MAQQARIDGETVYGVNPVVELLQAKRRKLIALYTTKPTPKSWSKIEQLLAGRGVQVKFVTKEQLTSMAGTTDHQGIVGIAQKMSFRSKPFTPDIAPLLVLLDGVQDPRNIGAILRSVYCSGFSGVIIPQKNSAPINAVALKSSAGLAEHLQIYTPASSTLAIQELKKAGYHIYLAAFNGENAATVEYKQPLCLVIGSEGSGIGQSLLNAGTQITLPQVNNQVSYNASVAAGILLFLVAYQKKAIGV